MICQPCPISCPVSPILNGVAGRVISLNRVSTQ